MVLAITGFAPMLADLGTRDAVVQRPRITEGEIAALFWITCATGVGFTALVAATGPLIAWFYGEPRVTMIAVVSSLAFITAAMTCQHQALLRRSMRFQTLAFIEVAAGLLSAALAITMAFRGWHYWALVIRPIAMNILIGVGVWFHCRWLPLHPTFTSGVNDMIRFGINLIGFSMTDFFGRSADRVAIGKGYGAHGLGHYQNALLVYGHLLDLMTALQGVAVGSLCKLVHALDELRRLWAKALSTVAFFAMPAFGLMAVTSQDLIVLLLGTKWSIAGVILSVFALRGMPHVVERTSIWLHVAAGRTDRLMRWGVFAAAVQVLALFGGLPFGPMGVAAAYVIAMYVLFVPAIAYAGRPLGIGTADVLWVVGPQILGAVTAAGLGFLLRFTSLAHTPRIERVAILAVAYVAAYLVIVVGFFGVTTPLNVATSLLRDFMPARLAPIATPRCLGGPEAG
jgi:PST family polysaccharide transporter